jgi:tRNA U34 5-methylaminomethyl-2-thiouridine-forming methyltransferase MnmC
MSLLKIITTSDGSSSLLNTSLNETYHSVHGAIQESTHVFIKHGLDFVMEYSKKSVIHILEVGFGTGLNTLLTLQKIFGAEQGIQYTTLEAFPVEEEVWRKLNYADTSGSKTWFEKLHQAEWNGWNEIAPNFQLRKLNTTLQQVELDQNHFELIYFDAFAPSKQPELWELPILKKVTDSMMQEGVFVTYCAKGQLKRNLKNLNLIIESLPGPPGKREMVRAIKRVT